MHKGNPAAAGTGTDQGIYDHAPSGLFKKGLVKIEIGLARGKKLYDKRDDLRKKAIRRETERDYRNQLKI